MQQKRKTDTRTCFAEAVPRLAAAPAGLVPAVAAMASHTLEYSGSWPLACVEATLPLTVYSLQGTPWTLQAHLYPTLDSCTKSLATERAT